MLARISHGSPCPNSGKYQLRRYGSEFPTEVRCLTQLVIGCNRSDIVHIHRYCSHTTNSNNFYFIGTLVFSLHYWHNCFIDTVALLTPLRYWHPCIIDTLALLTPLHYWHPCIIDTLALLTPLHYWHPYIMDTLALMTPLHYWHPYIMDTLALLTPLHYGHPWTPIIIIYF